MKPQFNCYAYISRYILRSPGLTRPLTSEERRRAQRVLLRVPVRIKVVGKETGN